MNIQDELFDDFDNPLDTVEDILTGHDWSFTRPNEDELHVNVTGNQGAYNMRFLWDETHCALKLECDFDFFVPKKRKEASSHLLQTINEELWLGHFEIPADSQTPRFRYTTLFRGIEHITVSEHVAYLVEIALTECEKHYNVISMLSDMTCINNSLLDLALVKEAGRA